MFSPGSAQEGTLFEQRAAESRNSDHTRTMAVPQQMQMGGGNGFPALAGPNLFVKQTKRGCLQVE